MRTTLRGRVVAIAVCIAAVVYGAATPAAAATTTTATTPATETTTTVVPAPPRDPVTPSSIPDAPADSSDGSPNGDAPGGDGADAPGGDVPGGDDEVFINPVDPSDPGPAPPVPDGYVQTPPPPVDLAALQALEAARVAEAVADAERAAAAANAAAHARAVSAASVLARAEADESAARAELAERSVDADTAIRDLDDAASRLSAVAVHTYRTLGTNSGVDTAKAMMLSSEGQEYVDAVNSAVYSTAISEGAKARFDTASVAADAAVEAQAVAQERLDAAVAAVADAQAGVDDAARVVAETEAANVEAVAAARQPRPVVASAVDSGGPTILGDTVISAEDMAAFVHARGRPHPDIDIESLARWFVIEGHAEGIAADLAWVQAIIETGWFSFRNSMVHTSDHNYAGIGACDSCRGGFTFASPRDGVRAQMQLLRMYATPGITSEGLAYPPVRTRPERLGVRGCCDTWMALSGVWATGPGYGVKILTLYNQMLDFAAARAAR